MFLVPFAAERLRSLILLALMSVQVCSVLQPRAPSSRLADPPPDVLREDVVTFTFFFSSLPLCVLFVSGSCYTYITNDFPGNYIHFQPNERILVGASTSAATQAMFRRLPSALSTRSWRAN